MDTRLLADAEEFLKEHNSTLWGRAFDIKHEDSRKAAAEWLTRTIEAFEDYQSSRAGGLQ